MYPTVYRVRSIERHCCHFARRFSGCTTSGRILRRVTAIAASRMHACTDSCALVKPKRATWVDVEVTGGLSRAVMDVGRLKFSRNSVLSALLPISSRFPLSILLTLFPSLSHAAS